MKVRKVEATVTSFKPYKKIIEITVEKSSDHMLLEKLKLQSDAIFVSDEDGSQIDSLVGFSSLEADNANNFIQELLKSL